MNRKEEVLGDMGIRTAGMLGKAMDAYKMDPENNLSNLRTALRITKSFIEFAGHYNQTNARRAN